MFKRAEKEKKEIAQESEKPWNFSAFAYNSKMKILTLIPRPWHNQNL